MPYKWLKFFILWIPTITIGIWEYVRHTFLLSYISMDLGNFLAPLLVLLVTITLLRGLFVKMEQTQEALQRERMMKASFEQREQLARDLHDGISQSLFLLSVKLDRLEKLQSSEEAKRMTEQIRGTVKHVYEDVRQSIANLQSDVLSTDPAWMNALHSLADEMLSSGSRVEIDWRIPDELLSNKAKVELLAMIREALMNVRKHADADLAIVRCVPTDEGMFRCEIIDNGVGAAATSFEAKGRYGVKMMRDRAKQMGWQMNLKSVPGHGTTVEIMNRRPNHNG